MNPNPETKKQLAELGESCKNKGLRLRDAFLKHDNFGTGKVSAYEFRNALEKINPHISGQTIQNFSNPYKTSDERINYNAFIDDVDRYTKSKNSLNQILKEIVERFEAGETNLFELFLKADQKGEGSITVSQFEETLQDFGIYSSTREIEEAMDFLDLNGDKKIDYKELRIAFDQYCREKGKSFENLQKSNIATDDPENYWARDIMIKINRYLISQDLSLEGFLMSMNMASDDTMSQFDFLAAISAAVSDIDRKQEDRLVNEYEDKRLGKISLTKFKRMFEKVTQISNRNGGYEANRGSYGGAGHHDSYHDHRPAPLDGGRPENRQSTIPTRGGMSFAPVPLSNEARKSGFSKSPRGSANTPRGFDKSPRATRNEAQNALQKVINAISLKTRNIPTFFESYSSFNRYRKTIREQDFNAILRDVNLTLDQSELRAIAAELDKNNDGVYELEAVLSMQPTSTGPDLSKLQKLINSYAEYLHRENLDLFSLFKKYDYRSDGVVTVDEFNSVLREARITLNPGDLDKIKENYGTTRGEIKYAGFAEWIMKTTKGLHEREEQHQKELLKDFYTKLRETYNTIDDFFAKYDANGDKNIDKSEFIKIIKDFDPKMQPTDIVDLFTLLDPQKTGKLTPQGLSQAFQPYLEVEVKTILQDLFDALARSSTNYYKHLNTYPVNGPFIKRMDLQDAIDSLASRNKISKKNLDFLLSRFHIKPNLRGEIDLDELGSVLEYEAKQHRLLEQYEILRIFEKPTKQKSPSEVQRFADRLTSNDKRALTTGLRVMERRDDRYLLPGEFERLLLKVDDKLSERLINDLFKELDPHGFGTVATADFIKEFHLETPDNYGGREGPSYDMPKLTYREELALKQFKEKIGLNTKKEVLDFYRSMDANDDKAVSFPEFKRAAEIVDPTVGSQTLMTVFELLDPNNTNKFTSKAFLEAMSWKLDTQGASKSPRSPNNRNRGFDRFATTQDINLLRNLREDLSERERRELISYFENMERENDRYLTAREFREIIKFLRPRTPDSDVTDMFSAIDTQNNKRIAVGDFLSAMQISNDEVRAKKRSSTPEFERRMGRKTPLQEFRENLTYQMKKDIYEEFQTMRRKDDRYLEYFDFAAVIHRVDRYIKDDRTRDLFNEIDNRRLGSISNQQFIEALELQEIADTRSNPPKMPAMDPYPSFDRKPALEDTHPNPIKIPGMDPYPSFGKGGRKNALEDFEEKLTSQQRREMLEMLKYSRKIDEKFIGFDYFKYLLQKVDPYIDETHVKRIFELLEPNFSNEVLTTSFLKAFNLAEDDKPAIVKKTEYAAEFLEELTYALLRSGRSFKDEFYSYDYKIPISKFRNKLNEYHIKPADTVNQLVADLTDEKDFYSLKYDLLEQLFTHYKQVIDNKKTFKARTPRGDDRDFGPQRNGFGDRSPRGKDPYSPRESSRDSYWHGKADAKVTTPRNLSQNRTAGEVINQIMEAMRTNGYYFSIFSELDPNRKEYISDSAFRDVLKNKLRLKLDTKELDLLEKEIYDRNGAVSLVKLRNALDPGSSRQYEPSGWDNVADQRNQTVPPRLNLGDSERKVDELIRKIKEVARYNGMTMEQVFKIFDENHNDFIEFHELDQAVRYLDAEVNRYDIVELFKYLDKNKDGKISMKDFLLTFPQEKYVPVAEAERILESMKRKLRITDEKELKKMYRLMDTNGSRSVNVDEFATFAKLIEPNLNRDQILAVFQLADTDGNGRLSYVEFCNNFDPNNVKTPRKRDDSTQTILQQAQWASAYLEELQYLLSINRTDFADFFYSSSNKMRAVDFRKKLLSLDFDITKGFFEKFLDTFGSWESTEAIDISAVKVAFDYYSQNRRADPYFFKQKHLNKIKEQIVTALQAKYATFDDIFRQYERAGGSITTNELNGIFKRQLSITLTIDFKILVEHLQSTSRSGYESDKVNIGALREFISAPADTRFNNVPRLADQTMPVRTSYTNNLQQRRPDQFVDSVANRIANDPKATSILNSLKQQIEWKKIEVEKLFEPFHILGRSKIDFTQFSEALRKIDNNIYRDDAIKLFQMLDPKGRNKVNKFDVIYSLSRIPPLRIAQYLASHRNFFAEINEKLAALSPDYRSPYRVFRPQQDLVSVEDFRKALWDLGFNKPQYQYQPHEVRAGQNKWKYQKEAKHIIGALLEGRTEGLNFKILELCLDMYKEKGDVFQPKELPPQEMENVKKVLSTVHNFMDEDKISFERLFGAKDKDNRGYISRDDLKHALVKELRIDETPVLSTMINYLSDDYGKVSLNQLMKNLLGDKDSAGQRRTPFGVQPSITSLQEFIKAIREKFHGKTEAIIKFYDHNDNQKISRREFIEGTIQALSLTDETCGRLFKELDKHDKGFIMAWEFKDILDSASSHDKEFLLKLANFVMANEREVLKSLRGVDDAGHKKLSNIQLKMAFGVSGFPLTDEELEKVIQATNVAKDLNHNIHYDDFIDRIKRLITEAEKQGGATVDDLLRRIKVAVIAKGIDLVQVLKQHESRDPQKKELVTVNDILEELSKIGIYLNRHERESLFSLLPMADFHVNYIEFAKLVISGRGTLFNETQMRTEFSWAESVLRTIGWKLKDRKLNLAGLFGTNHEFLPIVDFRHGMQQIGIDYGSPELRRLVDQLTDPHHPVNLSLFKLQYLLDNVDLLFGPPKKKLTPEDEKLIDLMMKNIRQFMVEDKLTFQSLFGKYDPRNQGFISGDELKKIIYHDLGIDETPKTNRFIELMLDERKYVDLHFVLERLEASPQNRQPQQQQGWGTQSNRPATSHQPYSPSAGQYHQQRPYTSTVDNLPIAKSTIWETQPTPRQDNRYDSRSGTASMFVGDSPQGLMNQIRTVLKNRGWSTEQKYGYFIYGTERITMDVFVEKVAHLGIRAERGKAEALFRYLDINNSRTLSKYELQSIFEESDGYRTMQDSRQGTRHETRWETWKKESGTGQHDLRGNQSQYGSPGLQDSRYGSATERYDNRYDHRTTDSRYDPRPSPRDYGRQDERYGRQDERYGTISTTKNEVLMDDSPQGLVNQLKAAFRNRGWSNEDKYRFFDEYGTGGVPMDIFVEKVAQLGIRALTDRRTAEDMFTYLDVNKSRFISKQEFQVIFDETGYEMTEGNVKLSNDIQQEIYKLFKEIDVNNDGSIVREELAHVLAHVGSHPSTEEIEKIFNEFDADRDGKITYEEFRALLEKKLKKDLLQMEQLLSDLRFEFRKADINNDRQITAVQLNQVLLNLGIELKHDELVSLVKVIDTDKNGKIDIDEFIDFMISTDGYDQLDPLASSAVLNIKRYKKLSPLDLFNCFKAMPSNYILSFTRDQTRLRENLPSATIKPQLDAGGIFFTDLFPNTAVNTTTSPTKRSSDRNYINSYVRPFPSDYACDIRLTLATGIPIPHDLNVDRRGQLVGREVRAVLYDFSSSKFVGNTVNIPADWRPEYEDRWYFNPNKIVDENRILFRICDFNEKTQNNLAVVFEFVLFFKAKDNQMVEMSAGWTKIEVTKLNTPATHILTLNGGTPRKMISINENEVLTRREGWRWVVKKITKKIISKLTIEVTPHEKLYPEVRNQLSLMPKVMLLNRNALNLLRYSREHLAKLAADNTNPNAILQNIHAKTFRNAMDCPDVWHKFYIFWNLNVQPRLLKAPSPDNGIEFYMKCLDHLYLLFSSMDFSFSQSDPTQQTLHDYSLNDKRAKLLNSTFEKIIQALSINVMAKKMIGLERGFDNASVYKPFHILELIDEDEDSYVMEQLQRLKTL